MTRRSGWRRAILAAGVALAPAAAAGAAEETLAARSGPPIVGEVLEVSETNVKMQTAEGCVVVDLVRLAPAAVHALLRRGVDDPARPEARLALAEACARAEAFDPARAELRAAATLDPTLARAVAARLDAIDRRHAEACYREGLEAMIGEEWERAVEALRTAAERFPETVPGRKARETLARAKAGLAKAGAAAKPPAPDSRAGRIAAFCAQCLARAATARADADARNREGLTHDAAGEAVKAGRAYQAAVDAAAEARAACARVVELRRFVPDPAVADEARRRTADADRVAVLAYLNLVSLEISLNRPEPARAFVTFALEIDPTNARAHDLKAKIEAEILRRNKKTPADGGAPKDGG